MSLIGDICTAVEILARKHPEGVTARMVRDEFFPGRKNVSVHMYQLHKDGRLVVVGTTRVPCGNGAKMPSSLYKPASAIAGVPRGPEPERTKAMPESSRSTPAPQPAPQKVATPAPAPAHSVSYPKVAPLPGLRRRLFLCDVCGNIVEVRAHSGMKFKDCTECATSYVTHNGEAFRLGLGIPIKVYALTPDVDPKK